MQPNDPRQPQNGFQGGQPIPQQPQPGFSPQPQQYAQPQQGYPVQPQPNTYAQQQPQPMSPPQPAYGQPPQPQQFLNPLEPSAQQFQPLSAQPANSGSKKMLFISLAAIVVLMLGVVGYVLATKSNTKTPTTTTSTQSNKGGTPKTPKTTGSFETLASFTLAAPTGAALGGMTPSIATMPDMYSTLTSSDGSCTIGFGILSQTALPGTDLNSLVAIKIADAKKQDSNIKASGPTVADSLVLKDTAGKTYAMPTAGFILSDTTTGGGTVNELYSAAELKDKSHAVVYIACNSDKPDDTSLAGKVNALLPVAKSIVIQPK